MTGYIELAGAQDRKKEFQDRRGLLGCWNKR